jgi:hypothetical protein
MKGGKLGICHEIELVCGMPDAISIINIGEYSGAKLIPNLEVSTFLP